jgi:hypothetical protein
MLIGGTGLTELLASGFWAVPGGCGATVDLIMAREDVKTGGGDVLMTVVVFLLILYIVIGEMVVGGGGGLAVSEFSVVRVTGVEMHGGGGSVSVGLGSVLNREEVEFPYEVNVIVSIDVMLGFHE